MKCSSKVQWVFCLSLCCWGQGLGAQQKNIYLDEKEKPCLSDEAFKHRIITQSDTGWSIQEFLVRPRVLLLEAKGKGDPTFEEGRYFKQLFFHNGQLKSLQQEKEGYLDGLQLRFFPDGMLKDSLYYQKGRLVGHQFGWYPDGSLRYEMQLDSTNLGQGICVGLFPNGQVSFKGRLAPDYRKTSDWFYYREDGSRAAVYRYGAVPDTLLERPPVLVEDKFEGIVWDTLVKPRSIYWFNAEGVQTDQPEQENRPARYGKKSPQEWPYYLQKELVAIPRLLSAKRLVYESHFVVNTKGKPELMVLDKKNLEDFDYGIKKIFESAPDWQPAFHANRPLPMLMIQTLRLGFEL